MGNFHSIHFTLRWKPLWDGSQATGMTCLTVYNAKCHISVLCTVLLRWIGWIFTVTVLSLFLSFSQWKTYNPTFSQVEIWFRFVFVVLTFAVTVRTQFTSHVWLAMNSTWLLDGWCVSETWQEVLPVIYIFFLTVLVSVCTLIEKVFHEGLGNRTEVDVHPATIAATLQWWALVYSVFDLYFN